MPADEAVDLVLTLPMGSRYKTAANPAAGWTAERHLMADVVDVLMVINWRLMGCPDVYRPEPVERPGDRELRELARKAARDAAEKIESTEWEEA